MHGRAASYMMTTVCPTPATQAAAHTGITSGNVRRIVMLYWAVVFFVIALVAALLGFTGIAVGFAAIAKILFMVFLVLFVVSLIAGLMRRTP